jgi:hypothetical protein
MCIKLAIKVYREWTQLLTKPFRITSLGGLWAFGLLIAGTDHCGTTFGGSPGNRTVADLASQLRTAAITSR